MVLAARLFAVQFFEDRIELGLLLGGQSRPEFVKVALAKIHQALPILAELSQSFLVAGFASLFYCGFVHWIISAPLRRIFLKCGFEVIQTGLLVRRERQAGDRFGR